MLANELDTKAAPTAWYAARDARMRNFAMSTNYSEAQKVQAERMKLEMVYSAKSIHINFRLKFITIKLESPMVRDRKTLALLEQDYERAGITKQVSAQGVIYRIKRA
jgi:hypothetical protein